MSIADLLLTLLVNVAWGFNFIAGKYGADHFNPLFFTSLRFFILFFLMLPWLKPAKGQMKTLLTVAFLMGVIHFGMVFMGIHASGNIGSVAITTQLYVPFSALFAVTFLNEKMSRINVLAITLAMAGVLLIGFDPIVFDHLSSLLWMTGASIALAAATIIMRKSPGLGVFRLQAWIALVAAPSLLLLSLIFESNHLEIIQQSRLSDLWSPAYSAIGASIAGHGVVYYLLGRHPVSTVTPLLLLAPVFATIFGILIFEDNLGIKVLVGGAMTLAGTLLVTISGRFSSKKLDIK